jgi:alpha-L-rhamnosidase
MIERAKPVWVGGQRPRYNDGVRFQTTFAGGSVGLLRIAVCSAYRAVLNGEFLAHGPARCAKGHFRVDEIDLSKRLKAGPNTLTVEVVHYHANAFSHINQPAYFQAEVVIDRQIVATTPDNFEAFEVPERLNRVQRYSYMRPMSEAYRLPSPEPAPIDLVQVAEVPLHRRRAPYPDYRVLTPVAAQTVAFEVGSLPAKPVADRMTTLIGTELEGYPPSEFEVNPWLEMQRIKWGVGISEATTFDFGRNATGFIGGELVCEESTTVLLLFDEILTDGHVDPLRLRCLNAIHLELAPGRHQFEAFEPNTLRYLAVVTFDGAVSLEIPYLRSYTHPAPTKQWSSGDAELDAIHAAAIESLCQNSVDLFMDCPHRERGGYLCDSFFTARAYHALFGNVDVEHDFLENYLLPDHFDGIPNRMLPMCYPSDALGGTYIPQWAMWFVLQLAEFRDRGGSPDLISALRPRVEGVISWLRQNENNDGLLESLPGWNFIEWSKANEWVQDVHYPTNMLYAAVLRAVGELYGDETSAAHAKRVLNVVTNQSFDGDFFVDNAERGMIGLSQTGRYSEVCQYFAFFFGAATPEGQSKLWLRLRDQFGPDRTAYPQVAKANAFIGNLLRLDLLPPDQAVKEIRGYYAGMAATTGTLWENDGAYASCNHGFASYVAVLLERSTST